MRDKYQDGFAALVLLIVVVVLCAVGAAAYFAFVNTVGHPPAVATPMATASPAPATPDQAVAKIKTMYDDLKNHNSSQADLRSIWLNYLTPSLMGSLTQKSASAHTDVLTCQQTYSPTYDVVVNSSTPNAAEIRVTGRDDIPGVTNHVVTYMVELSDLKVTATSCAAK